MDVEKVIEQMARAVYDRACGKGAFDEERCIRDAMGLTWPTNSFQGLYSDQRAAFAVAMEAAAKNIINKYEPLGAPDLEYAKKDIIDYEKTLAVFEQTMKIVSDLRTAAAQARKQL